MRQVLLGRKLLLGLMLITCVTLALTCITVNFLWWRPHPYRNEIILFTGLAYSLLFTSMLGYWLRYLLFRPILDLLETMRQVSGKKNYSLRAKSSGNDEMGALVASFNDMLEQIQRRDAALEQQRTNLELEVAARTMMNAQLESAKEVAEAASRAKGEFLASVSHEIRTPINGILGMSELALETALSDEQRDYMLMVRASGEALLAVINDILDYSKVEAGKLELESLEFHFYNFMGEMMKSLAVRADQKGVELIYDIRPEVPSQITGDPARLRQILLNLTGNAIKFTEHGEVLVEVGCRAELDGSVELQFKISDTGIGIPREKQRLIFQPFAQAEGGTARQYGGAGLGLAISAQLVEAMGGKIWVESEPGKGSTFFFTIKSSRSSIEQVPLISEDDLRGVSVLIVDDNATNRRILYEVTRRWGMQSSAVESGPAALTALEEAQKKGAPFQVMLLDACMPQMDGFQLASKIMERTELKGPATLMLTSAGQPGEAARCRKLRIAAYLLKPILNSDLQDAIRSVLGATRSGNAEAPLITRHTLRESPHKLRILIAEDNAVNQALIVRVLEKMGHFPTIAPNGRDAVALATTQRFDLVFMDVLMPELDGLQATVAIREHEKTTGTHLPIFAMTARVMEGDREECLRSGMDGYIPKPVRFSDIQETLSDLRRSSSTPRPAKSEADPAPWSKSQALDRVGGDEELLQELCQIFISEYPKLLEKVREAIVAGNAEGVQRAAHSLKGEVSYLGAPNATETARLLEDMGRAKDLSRAPETLISLEQALSSLHSAIEHPTSVR